MTKLALFLALGLFTAQAWANAWDRVVRALYSLPATSRVLTNGVQRITTNLPPAGVFGEFTVMRVQRRSVMTVSHVRYQGGQQTYDIININYSAVSAAEANRFERAASRVFGSYGANPMITRSSGRANHAQMGTSDGVPVETVQFSLAPYQLETLDIAAIEEVVALAVRTMR